VYGYVDAIEASTQIYVPPEAVYEFVEDFSGYVEYSEHLDRIEQYGDGGPGTEYRITVSWWRLSYTAETRVTAVDPPNRIDWRAVSDIRASGSWIIEPVAPPEGRETATELRLRIEFEPTSIRGISLPATLSVEKLFEKIRPIVVREARKIVEAMVADLEGEPREVSLEIHQGPTSV
jgi:ribosome-associated toxin RatA of RatAB toxin-antitoxin module